MDQEVDMSTPAPMTIDEQAAIDAVLYGSTLDRMHVGLRALHNLMRDPEDTLQIFVLAVALDKDHIPGVLFRFLCEPGGLELLQDQPAIDASTIDLQALAALPEGTLGHTYAHHLMEHDLDPDLFQAPPALPPAVAYFAQRFRQCHDVWHVLTGYEANVAGEIALQAFCHGQLGTPAPALAAITGSLQRSLSEPLVALRAWDAYQRGKRARFLLSVRWEELWDVPLHELRRRFHIPPARI
jgi:ubiquinone biosynthesis protein COQ4